MGNYVYDGQTYEQGETHHDLGSFICTDVKKEETEGLLYIRNYMGNSADVTKLPTYDSLATGSTAFCIDTGTVLMYEKTTKTWCEL